ncbi:MAG: aspartate carbamoyltransferase catalytic subunit [Gammaproteobacteria bacterium]|nr:aspartate carbamoyltransferase catalytic subunit [Gammaproteobacteria bacterium]
MHSANLQLNGEDKLKHFLTIDGLKREVLTRILDAAEPFTEESQRTVKKLPLLTGTVICNLFFDTSPRLQASFEVAAKRLSADVLNLDINIPATSGDETLLDTLRNLEAMHVDLFVVRHPDSGAAHFIARHVAPHVSVINAGDGHHAHPTQAMLDMFTIRRYKEEFVGLRVAIIGDVLHSGVARSQILALNTLGTSEVRVIGPPTLLPTDTRTLGVHVFHDLEEGIDDADVIILLRLQKERMNSALLPGGQEYFRLYGLTGERLQAAKQNVIILHPGPMNRGVELDSKVADGPRSVIPQQVSFGIAIRMAIMSMTIETQQVTGK